jgi:poly-gamma-glutamate capsule biosynthesis protein CapA/YwtB (metallophosphatase superfamily)
MSVRNLFPVLIGLVLLSPVPATAGELLACAGAGAAANDETITIKAVGDIVLGNNWPSGGWPANFEETAPKQLKAAIGEGDVIFGNFEGALTTHPTSTKVPRGTSVFAFRMPPRFAQILSGAGFNAMAIANNHTFDFGAVGYADTKKYLAEAGMVLIGEPHQITLQKVRGVTIAWVGFSHLPHHNYIGDLARLETMMKEARAQADLVIVSMQAGAEGNEALRVRNANENFLGESRGNTFAFARGAVDLGADLVIGHGPHVLRGMECYQGKLIAYSLGNFVGYGTLSTRRASALTTVLEVKLNKDRSLAGFNLAPLRFDDDRLPVPDNDRLTHYLVNDLSARAPLAGNVKFPVSPEGEAVYRRWLAANDLTGIIAQKP